MVSVPMHTEYPPQTGSIIGSRVPESVFGRDISIHWLSVVF
jgi:hypothetical protein